MFKALKMSLDLRGEVPHSNHRLTFRAINIAFRQFLNTRYRAASGGPRSPFGFEEAFKGGRGILGGKFPVLTNDAF